MSAGSPLFARAPEGALRPRLSLGQLIALSGLLVLIARLGLYACTLHGFALSRATPGIWFNALDLLGRGALGVLLCLLVTQPPWGRQLPRLALLGRHSLLLYGLHLPFCYGRFAGPLKRSSSLPWATLWLFALCGLCWLVARGYEQVRQTRSRNAARAVSLAS